MTAAGTSGPADEDRESGGRYATGTTDWSARIEVPTALALFPRDIGAPPREFAEHFFDVVRYTRMPRGGYFVAHEEPELTAGDIRAFVAGLGRPPGAESHAGLT